MIEIRARGLPSAPMLRVPAPPEPVVRGWLILLLVRSGAGLSALASLGCTGATVVDIEGEDRDRVLPKFLTSIELTNTTSRASRWSWRGFADEGKGLLDDDARFGAPASPFQVFLDFEVGRGEAQFGQTISAGERIALGESTIQGATRVVADAQVTAGSVAVRAGQRYARGILGVEGLFGLGYQNVETTVTSPVGTAASTLFSLGPIVGGKVSVRPLPFIGVYGQVSYTLGLARDPAGLMAAELGLELRPLPAVSVLGGWRWWQYDEERESDTPIAIGSEDDSDIDFELSGPMVGLQIVF
jgi:hypothetical protein